MERNSEMGTRKGAEDPELDYEYDEEEIREYHMSPLKKYEQKSFGCDSTSSSGALIQSKLPKEESHKAIDTAKVKTSQLENEKSEPSNNSFMRSEFFQKMKNITSTINGIKPNGLVEVKELPKTSTAESVFRQDNTGMFMNNDDDKKVENKLLKNNDIDNDAKHFETVDYEHQYDPKNGVPEALQTVTNVIDLFKDVKQSEASQDDSNTEEYMMTKPPIKLKFHRKGKGPEDWELASSSIQKKKLAKRKCHYEQESGYSGSSNASFSIEDQKCPKLEKIEPLPESCSERSGTTGSPPALECFASEDDYLP